VWIAGAGLLGGSPSGAGPPCPTDPVFDLPRLTGVRIDGRPDDWASRGLRIDLLAAVDGGIRGPIDFDPRLRLGWDDDGLLIWAEVPDDAAEEADPDRRLFEADSLEFFVGTGRGVHDYFMLALAPGRDPEHPQSRHVFFDERDGGPVAASSLPPLAAELAVVLIPGGYRVEARLP
jgi:hypothetical protein